MIRSLVQSLCLALLFGVTSCTAPPTATTPPSPQPIKVSISPFLEPVRDALHTCAVSLTGIALIVDVVPQNFQDFNTSDIVIWWGDKPDGADFAFQIGEESLTVIVHPGNTNNEISASELQALFNGRVEHWSEISIFDEDVAVWLYPESSYPSEIFKLGVLDGQNYSRLAHLVPSPGPMVMEISTDPGAIGFIPQAWLTNEVFQVNLDPELSTPLNRPILAVTNSEPHSGVKDLLACLQSGDGQRILSAVYDSQQN